MVRLSLKSGGTVGTVPDADFQMLVDQLEEESEEDTDYYVTAATIALLEERGASEALLAVLRRALGAAEGVDVSWERS
jgi:hypothetical protein